MLLKIPGVNSKNVHRVMTKVENLAAFCQMSEDEMAEVLENSKAAKEAYEFVNASVRDDDKQEEMIMEAMAGASKKTPMPSGSSAPPTSTSSSNKFLKTKSKSSTGGGYKRAGSFSSARGSKK